MIKAVLFDLDGVLVDLGPVHYEALNTALKAHGYLPISPEEHKSEYDGLPTKVKLSKLIDIGRVRVEDVDSICALKQKETLRLADEQCKFSPEKYCLIAGLKRAQFKVGIVSNAVFSTVSRVCAVMGIIGMIDVFTTNEDGLPKPNPDLYLKACKRFQLKPYECLAVEDGHYGVDAAREAGCRVLEVENSSCVTPINIWKAVECKNAHDFDSKENS